MKKYENEEAINVAVIEYLQKIKDSVYERLSVETSGRINKNVNNNKPNFNFDNIMDEALLIECGLVYAKTAANHQVRTMKLSEILEEFPDIEFLSADGFDEAVIGFTYDKSTSEHRLIYSINKCYDILVKRDNMSREEAEEYFVFNVSDAYVGNKTPIWFEDTY